MSAERAERTYLENFRNDCLNVITYYSYHNPGKYQEVLEQMLKIAADSNLSEVTIWNSLTNCCTDLYKDRFWPRFIHKHDVDSAFEWILQVKYPIKTIENEVSQLLYNKQMSQGFENTRLNKKIKEVENNNTLLKKELEIIQNQYKEILLENQNLTEENEKLKAENILLKNEVSELNKTFSESSSDTYLLKKNEEWKTKFNTLSSEKDLINKNFEDVESQLKLSLENMQKLKIENTLLLQKNTLLVNDNRGKADEIFNLKSTSTKSNETVVNKSQLSSSRFYG